MSPTKAQIERAIGDISIAALRSWLRSQELPHSANTREEMAKRFEKLLEEGKLSWGQLEEGITGIEEASAKRISLYRIGQEDLAHLGDPRWFRKHLEKSDVKAGPKPVLAPRLPSKPTLVYVMNAASQIRAKWAETQTATEIDLAREQLIRKKVTKIVVLIFDKNDGLTQLRFDKPELIHRHLDDKNKPSSLAYFSFYRARAAELAGVTLNSIELRNALRSLVETTPRIVRLPLNDFRTGANSRVRFASRTDIRDDDDWKAMHGEGGNEWAHDSEAVYWLPSASNGKLTREEFTDLDARTGKVRVEADCHEGEIEYAIFQIREHLSKTS